MTAKEEAEGMLKYHYNFIFGLRLNCELASEEYCLQKAKELSIYHAEERKKVGNSRGEIGYWNEVAERIKKIQSI